MDKTETQIEKEKQAVASMANAKSNMTTALDRILTLERALRAADSAFSSLSHHVGPHSKLEDSGGRHILVTDFITLQRQGITKVLP